MAVNKNAILRYQVFDKCFRNLGKMYFLKDLLDECNAALQDFDPNSNGIQRRQLFDDIKFMESEQGWSIPLERHSYGKKVFYRYSDLSFSINNQPLNKSEAEQMQAAIMILSRFSGAPQFEWMSEIIPVLENKLGIKAENEEVISYETNIDLIGRDHLSVLFNAIVNKRALKILYKDFKSESSYSITLHPYYLKQYNNRWFVLGLNEAMGNSTWNMSLDRIEDIKETTNLYKKNETDWEDYFFDIVGVTRYSNLEIQEITLHFNNDVAPYVKTKPLHPTQKTKEVGSGLDVKIQVIPNYELETLILSFGEGVKVISPDDLRIKINGRLKNAFSQY